MIKKFNEFLQDDMPYIRIIGANIDGQLLQLNEGTWINGRYERNIRIDRDTHFSDADENGRHAHVYGRTDRDNALVAVRQTGTSSHGLKGKLHKADADALRQRGFGIPKDNIVEYLDLPRASEIILLIESL